METIKDTVKIVMHTLKAGKGACARLKIEDALKKTLTKKEIGHIKFNYFKRGILNITVDSSSWLYQLSLSKDDLLARLRKKLKDIKDIRLRLGRKQDEKEGIPKKTINAR